jgi:DNA-binding HxlR family transcriptional regulator
MNCGIAQALERVGDWWSLLIVRDAFFGVSRFAQFEASLGISKNILTDRLQKLVEHGILERERLNEPGHRFEYKLTHQGRDLWLVLTAMRLWSDRWVFGDDQVPLIVRERGTGRRVAGLLAVDENGDPIDPSKLEWVRGPGMLEGPGDSAEVGSEYPTNDVASVEADG